jgi:hypothetical protein
MVRLTAIIALTVWSLLSQPLLAAEECPYLTNAEVEAETGSELLFKFSAMPLPDGPGTACDSSVVRVIFIPGENAASRWDVMMQGAGRAEEERFPITELGEGAYALRLEPRADNEYPTALVVVPLGTDLLGVSVRAEDGEAAAAAEPHAIALMKLAIPRAK